MTVDQEKVNPHIGSNGCCREGIGIVSHHKEFLLNG